MFFKMALALLQGLRLDVSCAAALHASLQALRAHPDADLLDIVQLLATKPMQVYRGDKKPASNPFVVPKASSTIQ